MLQNIIIELSKSHGGSFKILVFIIFPSYCNTINYREKLRKRKIKVKINHPGDHPIILPYGYQLVQNNPLVENKPLVEASTSFPFLIIFGIAFYYRVGEY